MKNIYEKYHDALMMPDWLGKPCNSSLLPTWASPQQQQTHTIKLLLKYITHKSFPSSHWTSAYRIIERKDTSAEVYLKQSSAGEDVPSVGKKGNTIKYAIKIELRIRRFQAQV